MPSVRLPLRGERLPDLVALDSRAGRVRLVSHLGGTPAAVLIHSTHPESCQNLLDLLPCASILCLAPHPTHDTCAEHHFTLPHDQPVVRADGAAIQNAILLLLDENLRLVQSWSALTLDALHRALREDPPKPWPVRPESRVVHTQAPVLLLPNALDEEACDFLIRGHAKRSAPTGIEHSALTGRQNTLDASFKRRRDWIIRDTSLIRMLTLNIGRRIFPELHRVWGLRLDRFEGFKIVSYRADERGFFAAHRDNLSPQTQHRQVALTINLNEGFMGGSLRFPEHSNDLYAPQKGHGLLFSCSLLHEVTPVAEGTRFALISFLYNEHAERKTHE